MLSSPFEQFELRLFLPISFNEINISISNTTISMGLVAGTFWLLYYLAIQRNPELVPRAWQVVLETVYEALFNIVKDNTGGKKGIIYFPFLFTLFSFIFLCNVLGMMPYSFTVTSHICITFGLAFSVCLALLVLGLMTHKLKFFSSFLPKGSPLALAPLLIGIELLSYISHAFSLSIRLFANMMAGHALLKILAGFIWIMGSVGGLFYLASLIPLSIVFALTFLEIGIAMLQAYVFTVLSAIYIKDTLYLH